MRQLGAVAPILSLGIGATAILSVSAGAQDTAGQAGFSANCAACHQDDGKGVEGAFPALAGNAFLLGPEAQPIGVVLAGRGGMPNFKNDLTDEQLARILTYARAAWGNRAPPVVPAAVAAERAKLGPSGG